MSQKEAPRGTQAVQRAIRLLKSFGDGSEVLTLSELARRHGLARPTAHRILAALEAEGMLARCPEGFGYRLGPQAPRSGLAGFSPPSRTSLHPRPGQLTDSYEWRRWSGFVVPSSYEPTHTREYFALRSAAGLIDVSPLFKYEIRGRDALAG